MFTSFYQRHVYSHIYCTLFTTAKKYKQPECPPSSKWVIQDKCTTECYSTTKGCHLVTRTDEEGIAGACAKFDKPGTERQAPHELTQMYNLTKLT